MSLHLAFHSPSLLFGRKRKWTTSFLVANCSRKPSLAFPRPLSFMPPSGRHRPRLLLNPQLPRQALVGQTPLGSCLSRVRAPFSLRRKAAVSSSSASIFRSPPSLSKIYSFPSGSTLSRIPTRRTRAL